MAQLNSAIPPGPLADKWNNHKADIKLVNPANKRKYKVLVVGAGLAGSSAAATMAELGYQVECFVFHDSPRRAHSIAAQGGINAAKNYQNDGDSVYRLFYDTIKGCDYRGFMTHRGIEKLCQTQVSYNEVPYIAERICGICGSVHATAFSQAVESAAGIVIPRRAEFIRTLMLEIERIHSNLLWLGVAGHLIGFDTVFMQAWRVREQIMWLCERLTGNRKTYGMILVGGVRRDITPDIAEDILNVVKKIEEELLVIYRAIENDSSIHKRTKGVGTITKQQAIDWNLIGPVARARGVDIDARRDHPYAAYDEMKFEVPVLDGCDVWSTLVVRVVETFEAIKIIRQCLDKMPGGETFVEIKDHIPAQRHAITVVEAPRGESVHYVITGENNRPERWRVRAPTFTNLQAVPLMLLDEQFADFPIIMGSIDPCFSCTDRVAVVDLQTGKSSSISKAELDAMSRKHQEGMKK